MATPRVAAVFEIPTPYRNPIFERVAQRRDLSVDFFFLSKGQSDRSWKPELFEKLKSTVLPGRNYSFPGVHTVHLNSGIQRQLLDPNYDAFVIGGYSQPALWRILRHCWASKKPYVMVTESHARKHRPAWVRMMKSRYVRKVYENAQSNLVVSIGAKEYICQYGAEEESAFFFPNCVDGPTYREKVDQERSHVDTIRRAFGIGKKQVILFVGLLGPVKGVDILSRAFEQISSDCPDACLVLVGTGPLEESLKQWAARANLQERVVFTGFLQPEKLPQLYAVADLLVLPSRHETFGAVVCEAMAAGLPVVASDGVGAVRDFVKHGENGLLVETENAIQLGNAMKRLLLGEVDAKQMGSASKERMMEWSHARLEEAFVEAVTVALR